MNQCWVRSSGWAFQMNLFLYTKYDARDITYLTKYVKVFFLKVILQRTLIIDLETSKCNLSTKALLIQSK